MIVMLGKRNQFFNKTSHVSSRRKTGVLKLGFDSLSNVDQVVESRVRCGLG
jgi:hypothetical protein